MFVKTRPGTTVVSKSLFKKNEENIEAKIDKIQQQTKLIMVITCTNFC